jgi:hypothetical protein
LRRIRWFERFSRPRATWLFDHRATANLIGLFVFGLTLSAFLAPPFSGLDTLPSVSAISGPEQLWVFAGVRRIGRDPRKASLDERMAAFGRDDSFGPDGDESAPPW